MPDMFQTGRVVADAVGVGVSVGGAGVSVGSSLLFATLYVGSFSLPFLVLIGLMGLGFAYCVDKTGSLWGVTVAHSLMAVGLILVWLAVAGLLP